MASEEFESLQQLYSRLVEVTQNEMELTEYLLPYESEVVDCILEQITHMNDVIERTKKRWTRFCVEQHQMELERFNYLINTYLRTRLFKIENDLPNLINMLRTDIDRATKLLSPLEAKYLDRFNDSIDGHFNQTKKYFPANVPNFRLAGTVQTPKTNYAFVEGCREVTITDGGVEITLEPDVCRILTHSTIRDIIEKSSKDLRLI